MRTWFDCECKAAVFRNSSFWRGAIFDLTHDFACPKIVFLHDEYLPRAVVQNICLVTCTSPWKKGPGQPRCTTC
jgi:hypothetical protein